MSVDVTDELLAAVEEHMGAAKPDLATGIPACLRELDACRSGLAYLDHLFGALLDSRDEARVTWESEEAQAAREARQDAPKAATATEIRGLITEWVNKRPSASKARDALRQAERRLEKVNRWMRTLEKRLGAAQSAQNGHETLGRYGGGA